MLPALTAALIALAPPPSGPSALAVIDAFLDDQSRTVPAFRTDFRRLGAAPPPPGFAVATSPLIGRIGYRSRTFADLAPAERRAVLRSGLLRAYVEASVRYGSAPITAEVLPLDPAELLDPSPSFVDAGPASPPP